MNEQRTPGPETPLPWHYDNSVLGRVFGGTPGGLGHSGCDQVCQGVSRRDGKFIAHACNSHAALMDALCLNLVEQERMQHAHGLTDSPGVTAARAALPKYWARGVVFAPLGNVVAIVGDYQVPVEPARDFGPVQVGDGIKFVKPWHHYELNSVWGVNTPSDCSYYQQAIDSGHAIRIHCAALALAEGKA